ncbi:MAG: NF038122 family metalloprotease [Blastocatellia bacterium]|nr:NF038122 family metalloprotease [Blastocatellia bacterium]
MIRLHLRFVALSAAACLLVPVFGASGVRAQERAPETDVVEEVPVPFELNRGHVFTMENGVRVCRAADHIETRAMKHRSPDEELKVINEASIAKARRGGEAGFVIILRGTTQLDGFPSAKTAMIRAAETWMALIRTPATVYIDVDFGPTRFGDPYPGGVLGSTDSNFPDSASTWSSMRARLLTKSNSQAETDLLNLMPPTSGIPTTEGTGTLVYISEIPRRALEIASAVAPNPAGNPGDGVVPSVGFNSAFPYDFDPFNGIDSNKQDFNATALHEFGHALGFVSHAGLKELVSSNPVVLTTWDLYRFRTGISTGTFTTAQRVTSSGGEQVQFTGGGTTRLSTGRPNGAGGDGNQASHWKDNVQNSGNYIGIMDPTGADGDLDELTQIDLDTLDFIGFDVKDLITVDSVTATFSGSTLNVVSGVTSANRRVASVRTSLLDSANQVLGSPLVTSVGSVGEVQTEVNYPVSIASAPTAAKVSVVAIDGDGIESAPTVLDFSVAEPGGGNITSAKHNGKKLTITGTGFTGTLTLEVNGVIVAPPIAIKLKGGGTKLSIKGSAATLGLVSGTNRIRVSSNGAFSNLFFLN